MPSACAGLPAAWAAAFVLAATRARSAGRPLLADGEPASDPAQVLAGLTEQILQGMPTQARAAVEQVAHLPLLSDPVVTRATGIPGLLTAMGQAGLPLQADDDGWSQLVGPVPDLLRARAAVALATLSGAAAAYAGQGRPDLAADLLITAA